MPFQVPATWRLFGASSDGSQQTYTRPGHTVQEPRLAIIDRTVAVFDGNRGKWSVPTYRVRVADGVLDADGNPDPTRTLLDMTCRSSLSSNGAARGDEVTADLLLIVDQTDFANAAFVTQEFPTVASA